MSRPNILLIQSDKHRWDCLNGLGVMPVQTPTLDRLAAEGIACREAYCPTPLCCPARASLQTGQWPTSHLCIANWDSEAPRGPRPDLPSFGAQLAAAGYWLGFLDKWHVDIQRSPLDFGFHEYIEPWQYEKWRQEQGLPKFVNRAGWYGQVDEAITGDQSRLAWSANRVIEWLRRRATEDNPFFIAWEPPEPHPPHCPPRDYAALYPPESLPPWPGFGDDLSGKPFPQRQQRRDYQIENWTWEQHWAPYVSRHLAMVTLLDHQIGRVLEELSRLGLAENTLVVYTTDHGDPVGEHGLMDQHFIGYDCVMKTPLLARWPGVIPPGTVRREFIINALDLARTFVEVGGGEVPATFQGVSLLPVFRGTGGTGRTDVFGMYHGNQFGLYTLRMIRDRRWKYIWHPTDMDELYDLDSDPGEGHNRIQDVGIETEVVRLRQRLVSWMEEIQDPMLNRWTRPRLLKDRNFLRS